MRSNKRKSSKRLSVGEGVVARSTLPLLLKEFILQSYVRKASVGRIRIYTVTFIVCIREIICYILR